MKKLLLIILTIVMLLSIVPLGAVTVGAEAIANSLDYLEYEIINGEVTITDCDKSISGEFEIPSEIEGYTVTKIGGYAFSNCRNLTSVIIPESVTNIEFSAFESCVSLSSINIPDSVIDIGGWAFHDTALMDESEWEDDVLYIGNCLLNAKNTITGELQVKEGTKRILYDAFEDCENLKTVIIPDTVITIGDGAFSFCKSLTSVNIPNSVTSIGTQSFYGCVSLTSIIIPESIISIGMEAFSFCNSLNSINVAETNSVYCSVDGVLLNKDKTSLVAYPGGKNGTYAIPDGVTTIGGAAFVNCKGLTGVVIPNSVTTISDSVFGAGVFYESGLVTIDIPDSVITIGSAAFASCESLISVSIGSGVCDIGERAFEECISLSAINVSESNQYYSSEEGVLFTKSKKTLVQYPCGKIGEYTIPNGVTSINDYMFGECDGLTALTIPDSVTYIGDSAFAYSDNLTTVSIGSGVTYIGNYVFESTDSLSAINVSEDNLHYSSIDGVLFNKDRSVLLRYPMNKTNVSFIVPNSVIAIDEEAFYMCTNLYSIAMQNSVTTIEEDAFYNCNNLTGVWYTGSLADREEIIFGSGNRNLTDATWHYNTCDTHCYFSECDTTCENCGWERPTITKHKYSSICDNNCDVCGTVREDVVHIYDDFIDEDCNYCNKTRIIQYISEDVETNAIVDSDGNICNIVFVPKQNGKYTFTVFGESLTSIEVYSIGDSSYGTIIYGTTKELSITCSLKSGIPYILFFGYKGETTVPYKVKVYKHVHIYENECDDECNNYDCSERREVSHKYDNDCDTSCNTCNATRITSHKWTATTCTEPKTCTVCGITDGTALGHNFANATCTEAKKCTVCGTTEGDKLGHTYTEVITKSPTCAVAGEKTFTCACGDKKTEVIAATGIHTLKTKTTKATYAKAGSKVTKCSVCGVVTSSKAIPKLVPKSTKISKVTAAKKSLKIKIKKEKSVSGYEIQYSLKKNFKSAKKVTLKKNFKSAKKVTLKKNSLTTKTIKKLKAKKTYYVRVRTFKTVNGKKYYSAWSKAVKKKTK